MRILKALLLLCIFLIADPIEIHVEKNKNYKKYIKDLNLIGDWSIEAERYFINFILTAGNKWDVSFEKNHEILLDQVQIIKKKASGKRSLAKSLKKIAGICKQVKAC